MLHMCTSQSILLASSRTGAEAISFKLPPKEMEEGLLYRSLKHRMLCGGLSLPGFFEIALNVALTNSALFSAFGN